MPLRKLGAAVCAALALGCSPQLIVRHLDPAVPSADIWVNGRKVERVDYGGSAKIKLEKGAYRVRASQPGETKNGWAEGGGDWNVIVLGDVILSLMPRPNPGTDASDVDGAPTP